ncbi:glycosyltransferase family 39 protein [Streptomyces sp. NPDC050759]|uniref:glycosyltransferase family 39 protein n=1 Tax=Streptomyces sp. NPDC050759 TaxID=3365635 RepID=UPI0037A95A69
MPSATSRTTPSARRPGHALVPAALSLALGLWGIRRGGSMWRDEVVTYDMARRSLPDLWTALGHADAVHGLYYLLMHALFRLCGDMDPLLVLRLPSVLATAAAAGILALLGRRLAGPRAGLLAGLAFSMLPPVQRYAQEGRSYAVVCALIVWATYLLVRAADRRTPGAWAAYGTVLLAACLLHEFAVLAVPAHLAALPRPVRRPALRVALVVCAALAPLAALSARQSDQVSWIGGPGAGALVGFAAVSALALACAVPLRREPVPRLAVPLALLPALTLILLTPLKPLYVDRYVLYGHAGTALLIGAALDRLGRTRALAMAAAVLALLPVTLQLRTPQSRTDDASAIARALSTTHAEGVVYLPSRRRVWSLVDPDSVRRLRDLALDRGPAASGTLYGTEVPVPVIRARMLATERIVAVGDPPGQPLDRTPQEDVKRQVLAEHFVPTRVRHVQGALIAEYTRAVQGRGAVSMSGFAARARQATDGPQPPDDTRWHIQRRNRPQPVRTAVCTVCTANTNTSARRCTLAASSGSSSRSSV